MGSEPPRDSGAKAPGFGIRTLTLTSVTPPNLGLNLGGLGSETPPGLGSEPPPPGSESHQDSGLEPPWDSGPEPRQGLWGSGLNPKLAILGNNVQVQVKMYHFNATLSWLTTFWFLAVMYF